MDYKQKYLKYKLKYLTAKKLYGGMEGTIQETEDNKYCSDDGKLLNTLKALIKEKNIEIVERN